MSESTEIDREALENVLRHTLQSNEAPQEEAIPPLPEELIIFPIAKRPFFPGMAAPLVIEAGPFFDALKICAKSKHKCIGLFLTRKEDVNVYKATFDDLYSVGVMARILRIIPTEQGGAQVILNMESRIKISAPDKEGKILKAKVEYLKEPPTVAKKLKAYSISIISTIKELLKLNPLFKEELQIFLSHSDFSEPGKLADFAAALTTASREELQKLLETLPVPDRIEGALLLLRKELDLSILQNNINKKIEAAISKNQREFFLREQLKAIKKELGIEKDDKMLEKERF